MKAADEIVRKYHWPTRNISDDTDMVDIEGEVGFELPSDYKDFISRYIGYETKIGKEYIKLWDKENLLSLNRGYQIFQNLKRTVGIGDNGAGEFIGFEKLDDGELRVILTPLIDLDRHYHLEIGRSFTDFLLRLDRGQKWFKDIEDS